MFTVRLLRSTGLHTLCWCQTAQYWFRSTTWAALRTGPLLHLQDPVYHHRSRQRRQRTVRLAKNVGLTLAVIAFAWSQIRAREQIPRAKPAVHRVYEFIWRARHIETADLSDPAMAFACFLSLVDSFFDLPPTLRGEDEAFLTAIYKHVQKSPKDLRTLHLVAKDACERAQPIIARDPTNVSDINMVLGDAALKITRILGVPYEKVEWSALKVLVSYGIVAEWEEEQKREGGA